jgi:hypothetical protein
MLRTHTIGIIGIIGIAIGEQIPKLCPKVILEGTRLTGKTDVAFALNRPPRLVGARSYEYARRTPSPKRDGSA